MSLICAQVPYSSVLLPEHYSTHCHHCYRAYTAPIPCLRCTQPRYCSEACRQASWDVYHRYECTGLDLLHSVGIAHLALRTLLVSRLSGLMAYRSEIQSKSKSANDNEIQACNLSSQTLGAWRTVRCNIWVLGDAERPLR